MGIKDPLNYRVWSVFRAVLCGKTVHSRDKFVSHAGTTERKFIGDLLLSARISVRQGQQDYGQQPYQK